jgi:RNA polymerase sigma factor (TIGR02999 family)
VTPRGSDDITRLLKAWSAGDETALERLTSVAYDQLRRMARRHMHNERSGNTLQTTALVNETYLCLSQVGGIDWKDRAHFFAVSAQIMRRVLVDAARARSALKRGGQAEQVNHSEPVELDGIIDHATERSGELIALDDALNGLARIDARKAQVIEMRFFGGLSVEETAEALSISPQSVMRDWKLARAWLARELRR